MRWLKGSMRKAGVVFVSLVLLLILVIVLFALIGPGHQTGTGVVQATPTIDVTAVAQDKLKQEDEQLQRNNSFPWTVLNAIGGPMLAALAAIAVAFFGLYQWRGNRNDERKKEIAAQDKDLRAQAEERFKAAVTALGDANEATQIGGAILLRSFLNPDDKKIYGRYYAQIFDLAVAYLRLSITSHPSEDRDGLPEPPVDPNTPVPLTPLRQSLIRVFREVFPLARERLRGPDGNFDSQHLDASHIRLDGAYLARADLNNVWFREAYFIEANLHGTQLQEADLIHAHLSYAELERANLSRAKLRSARLYQTRLYNVDLTDANLEKADLTGVNLDDAKSLKNTNLSRVKGLTKEQLETCKTKGAIIDEDSTASSFQSVVSSTQLNTPTPSTDGSSSTADQPRSEP